MMVSTELRFCPTWLTSCYIMLLDAWLLFFSKKVNFMVDLSRKYVCRSDVALVETHSFGVSFPLSGGIG